MKTFVSKAGVPYTINAVRVKDGEVTVLLAVHNASDNAILQRDSERSNSDRVSFQAQVEWRGEQALHGHHHVELVCELDADDVGKEIEILLPSQ